MEGQWMGRGEDMGSDGRIGEWRKEEGEGRERKEREGRGEERGKRRDVSVFVEGNCEMTMSETDAVRVLAASPRTVAPVVAFIILMMMIMIGMIIIMAHRRNNRIVRQGTTKAYLLFKILNFNLHFVFAFIFRVNADC